MDTSLAIGASGGFPWLFVAYCSPGYRVAMDEPGNSPPFVTNLTHLGATVR